MTPGLDVEKIFVVSWGLTKSKYAPRLYTPRVLAFLKTLHSMAGAIKMRDVLRNGSYGILPPGDSYDDALPIIFLRATEMMPNLKVDLASCHRIARDYFNPKARANVGDVLLAVKGATIASGKSVAIIEDDPGEAVINGSIFRMSFKDSIIPKYAAVVLDSQLLKQQMRLGLIANNGVDYLDKPLIHSLIFPAPDIKRQKEIVAIYDEAAESFRVATDAAGQLLAGIDDYILSELGITLPAELENTITNRLFKVRRGRLAGWRFDARVHQYDFELRSDRYLNVPLKQLVHVNPRTLFSGVKGETPLTFVPMEAISDEDGTIASPQQRIYSENVGYTSFQENDLLWAKITPCMENGKSAVAKNLLNGFGFGSTEYHVLRSKSVDLSIHYLHAILRMKCLRKAAENYFGGSSGHQRVDEAFFYRLSVPVPPSEIQEMLAQRIESMRQEARRLRSEAQSELDAAKRRIEAMLLGEVAA